MKRVQLGAAALTITATLALGTYQAHPAAALPGPNRTEPRFTLQGVASGTVTVDGYTPSPALRAAQEDHEERMVKAPDVAQVGKPAPTPYSFDGYRVARASGMASEEAAIVDTTSIDDGFMTAASTRGVDLSWSATEATTPLTIYRDGVKIATTTTTAYHDADVTPGRSYEYRVEHAPVLRESAESPAAEGAAADAHRPSTTSFGATVLVPTGDDAMELAQEAASENQSFSSGDDARVTFRAFIPDKTIRVSTPANRACWNNFALYSGDNRGFSDAKDASARITEHSLIYWGSKKVLSDTKIGASHALRDNGSVAETKTASRAATGTWVIGSTTTTSARIKQVIEGTNPFCPHTGSIYGDQIITVHPNGSFATKGSHRLMPNIEIYFVYRSGSGFKEAIIRQRKLFGPGCLLDHIPFCSEDFS